MPKKRTITDAVELMDRWFGDIPGWDRMVAEERLKLEVGKAIYEMRSEKGLTQKQLGDLMGTSQTVISKVEHSDYEGSAIDMFVRACFALKRRVEIHKPKALDEPFAVVCPAG